MNVSDKVDHPHSMITEDLTGPSTPDLP